MVNGSNHSSPRKRAVASITIIIECLPKTKTKTKTARFYSFMQVYNNIGWIKLKPPWIYEIMWRKKLESKNDPQNHLKRWWKARWRWIQPAGSSDESSLPAAAPIPNPKLNRQHHGNWDSWKPLDSHHETPELASSIAQLPLSNKLSLVFLLIQLI